MTKSWVFVLVIGLLFLNTVRAEETNETTSGNSTACGNTTVDGNTTTDGNCSNSTTSSSSSTGTVFDPNATDCLTLNGTANSCNYFSTGMPIDLRDENDSLIDTRWNTSYCKLDSLAYVRSVTSLSKNQDAAVCMLIGGKQKAVFFPKVDDYTLLQMSTNGTQKNRFDDMSMWIRLEVGVRNNTVISPPKQRRAATSYQRDERTGEILLDTAVDYVVPYWVAIVNMQNGVPHSIQWDDGCYTCKGDACVNDTCAVDMKTCAPSEGSQIDCDLKVYVAWFGTDNTGTYLTSAGKVPSRFLAYSVSSAVESAAFQAYDRIPDAPEFSGDNINEDRPNGDGPSD